ncbi:hypothetical protein ACP70R_042876 [Stipagrostis hirtigluma subsp. patula]
MAAMFCCRMDARAAAILFAVLLACVVFSANCDGGDGERPTAISRWRPDGKEMTRGSSSSSSKVRVVLCVKRIRCRGNRTCYCCDTLPDFPCYYDQQDCWDICPSRQSPVPSPAVTPAPAPAPAGSLESSSW